MEENELASPIWKIELRERNDDANKRTVYEEGK